MEGAKTAGGEWTGFNEAGAIEPRNPLDAGRMLIEAKAASMRPGQ